MAFVVASATEPDQKFETYMEACAWAESMRNFGVESVIVKSDEPWRYWDVWKDGMTRPHVVSARSEDEALVVARGITQDCELDKAQARELLQFEVTSPDGKKEIIFAMGTFMLHMYMRDYEARGYKVRMM